MVGKMTESDGEAVRQRFGKSQLMREMAKRFPGKVVHVTPENLSKRQPEPMIGDVVLDEYETLPLGTKKP